MKLLCRLLLDGYCSDPEFQPSFGEFVEKFFQSYAQGILADKTIKAYVGQLKPFLVRFGNIRIGQMTRQDLEFYFAGYGVSNRTKNIFLSLLRSIFKKAVEWNYLKISPAAMIKRFPECSQGSRALNLGELFALLKGRVNTYQWSIIHMMVYSGMRPGELSNLKWEDIDWAEERLKIVSDKIRKTKNLKSRFIPINPTLKKVLEFLKDYRPIVSGMERAGYRPRGSHQKEYVLCHPNGHRVKCFRKAVASAFEKHGVNGVTLHGLRKTFCSLLARQGVHPRVAQELMGHSDFGLTMRIYTEIDDDQLKEAVNRLNFSSIVPEKSLVE